jgi:hypothetical protein
MDEFGREGCYVRRILGRREDYVQVLYRISGTVEGLAPSWRAPEVGSALSSN